MQDRMTDALVEGGLTRRDDIPALASRAQEGEPLFHVLVREGRAGEEQVAQCLSSVFRVPRLRLSETPIQLDLLALVPEDYARTRVCCPVRRENGAILLAVENPLDLGPEQEVAFRTGETVRTVISTRTEILEAIQRYYHSAKVAEDRFQTEIHRATRERGLQSPAEGSEHETSVDLLAAESEPVVRMSATILADALRRRASDIHIEHQGSGVKVRYRVDGVLLEVLDLPAELHHALVSRFKILASLDIAEHRIPQDGRIKVRIEGRSVDLRVSTLPTHYGEKIVMRLLRGADDVPGLDALGMDLDHLSVLRRSIRRTQGMVLTTGPTGSGKSSTLFACLEAIHSTGVNIVTIENPIEYAHAGLNQVEINERKGLTFAKVLRSVLRQDPNVILVGEIRDRETAEIALQAANTGHLVFSTLHTNDAIATVTRLLNLGTTPSMVAEGLILLLAQRLLRRICPECKTPVDHPEPQRHLLGMSRDEKAWVGRGCAACHETGYLGRIAVYEMLPIDGDLRNLIARSAPEVDLRRTACAHGLRPLLEAAVRQVRAGVTSVDEVLRVIDLAPGETHQCPGCRRRVQEEFAICPFCSQVLHRNCPSCDRAVRAEWTACPFCRAPIEEGRETPARIVVPAGRGADQDDEDTPLAATPRGPAVLAPGRDEASWGVRPVEGEPEPTRILVLDRNPERRFLLGLLLGRLRRPVVPVVVRDLAEAMAQLHAARPDLVLLSGNLTDGGGEELRRRLGSASTGATVPTLSLAWSAEDAAAARAAPAGRSLCLTPPFDWPDLEETVDLLLEPQGTAGGRQGPAR
ncbi:MAG: Flp pilus assembly complex ATPase component TadA [Planctomycetes bacterium]|nr:Flp pilus assembly complex ATPase component TadA [Planctomycetota bacterium]